MVVLRMDRASVLSVGVSSRVSVIYRYILFVMRLFKLRCVDVLAFALNKYT